MFERHRVLGRAAKEGVKALGLELFGPDDPEANSVTAVKVPEGVDGGKIGKIARDKWGVWLAGGQGQLKGKIFRFGHCGYFGHSDIIVGLSHGRDGARRAGLRRQVRRLRGRRRAGVHAEHRAALRG